MDGPQAPKGPDRGATATEARLVPLRPGRPGPCIFLVPGLGGRIECFGAIGPLLTTAMPVFAIEARGVDDATPPSTQIGEMVEHYLTRIRSVQPTGPWFIVGHSFGGQIAFEMARRLRAANETIACLIILDTPVAKKLWPLSYYLKEEVWKSVRRHLLTIVTTSPGKGLAYLSLKMGNLRSRIVDPYGLKRSGIDVMIGTRIAFDTNDPGSYAGKLIFFRATIHDVAADPDILWRHRVEELEVHAAEGDHNGMLDPPYVAPLARDISACLLAAETAVAGAPDR